MMKKIGLVLGGGAVLGAAHVGVLRAIKEKEIEIEFVAGTSIGAFVAAFFAFGKSWEDIHEIAADLKWLDISQIALSKFGLLSNDKMGKLIGEHIGKKQIKDAEIPLAMVATDITKGEKVVLDKGSVADAVMASTAIPGIFNPVEIGKKMLVDGGVVENVPISTTRDLGAKYIIGVDLNVQHKQKKPSNILDVLLNSFQFMRQASSELQTEKADLMIKPDLSKFNRSNMDQVDDLMEKGYKDAKKALSAYKFG
ncbi:MAG: patatin-like phospholipase family protein [Bacteroidales bacterium]